MLSTTTAAHGLFHDSYVLEIIGKIKARMRPRIRAH